MGDFSLSLFIYVYMYIYIYIRDEEKQNLGKHKGRLKFQILFTLYLYWNKTIHLQCTRSYVFSDV